MCAMHLKVSGILSDFRGRVLLQRPDAKTLAPPGSELEPGSLPADTLGRHIRRETSLIVMPVRPTGIYFHNDGAAGELTFCFRCTMRGGDLDVPAGSPPAGFFDSRPLPGGLSPTWQRRIDQALQHSGGRLSMEREAGSPGRRWGQLLGRRSPEPERERWEVVVKVWGETETGSAVWVRSAVDERWRLPAAAVPVGEAPWETAGRLLEAIQPEFDRAAVRLALVELAADRPALTLVFAAPLRAPEPPPAGNRPLLVAEASDVTIPFSAIDADLVSPLGQVSTLPLFQVAAE